MKVRRLRTSVLEKGALGFYMVMAAALAAQGCSVRSMAVNSLADNR